MESQDLTHSSPQDAQGGSTEHLSLVLIAEDEKDIRDLVKLALRRLRLETIEAEDGVAAIAMVQSFRPDLVILDVSMPGMDGFEVCRRLRSDSLTRSIPVLILSARGQSWEVREGMEAGASSYIVKPFERAELVEQVAQLLNLPLPPMPNSGVWKP